MMRIGAAMMLVLAACSLPALPPLGEGGPATLRITASTPAYTMHAGDLRTPMFTITNTGGETSGVPTVSVSGLTLGTLNFSSNTCTSMLAPNHSCTVVGSLTPTSTGQVSFQVVAAATPGGTSMAAMSLTVLSACATTCGPSGATDCCASSVVPGNATGAALAGAAFFRSYDGATDGMYANMGFPATVSDFRLDTYEVTVGRFRAFVNEGLGTQASPPARGAGVHLQIDGSGWDQSFNSNLTPSTSALVAGLKCDPTYQNWTDSVGANESLPINCITWYEALAFCIWDGGYLPTEAEWNYAASGGSDQSAYPWSSPAGSTTIDCSDANYLLDNPAGTHCVNGMTGAANRVGSESPKGDGKFGQADLGGNVFEWNLDWYIDPYPTSSCNDCANLTAATNRVARGGGYLSAAAFLRPGFRGNILPGGRFNATGVRCARTP
jgi:formylglycine-generating enzyme